MDDNRHPSRRPDREPSQVIRRDPNQRPAWPPNPATPPQGRQPPPPPPPPPRVPPGRMPPPLPPRPPRQARPAPPPAQRPPPPRPPTGAAPPLKPTGAAPPLKPTGAAPPPPTAPKRRRKRHWGKFLTAVLLVGVLAVVGAGLWMDTSLHRITAFNAYPDRPTPGRGTNWLLVGSDSRQDLTPEQQAELATGGDIGTGRTDTILLVHIPELGSGTPPTMVSIPRDSYVSIPDNGKDKINAAFSLGGAPLLAQTVELATGLHLDHYAEIGFGGFADLVDAVGGVTVCPAEPISDPLAGIDLPAGCQQLDGRSALGFVRSRATPRADLDRMVHQRQFMSALLHRATSLGVLVNPLRWSPMAHAAANTVTVDQDAHIWDLARLGWALHGDPVTTTVPIGDFTAGDSGSVVVWDHDAASRLFDALASDSPPPADTLNANEPKG